MLFMDPSKLGESLRSKYGGTLVNLTEEKGDLQDDLGHKRKCFLERAFGRLLWGERFEREIKKYGFVLERTDSDPYRSFLYTIQLFAIEGYDYKNNRSKGRYEFFKENEKVIVRLRINREERKISGLVNILEYASAANHRDKGETEQPDIIPFNQTG